MRARKAAVVAFSAIAGFLAMASAAYACLPFVGNFVISGNYDNYATSQTVVGAGSFHQWCGGTPPWTIRVTKDTSARVIASVSPSTTCVGQLDDALGQPVYELRYSKGETIAGTSNPPNPCYQTPTAPFKSFLLQGGITVVNGSATINNTATFNAKAPDKYSLCVSKPTGQGNGATLGSAANVYSL